MIDSHSTEALVWLVVAAHQSVAVVALGMSSLVDHARLVAASAVADPSEALKLVDWAVEPVVVVCPVLDSNSLEAAADTDDESVTVVDVAVELGLPREADELDDESAVASHAAEP